MKQVATYTLRDQRVSQQEIKKQLARLVEVSYAAYDLGKRAAKAKQSLVTDNRYGRKFHELQIEIARIRSQISPALNNSQVADVDRTALINALDVIVQTQKVTTSSRHEAYKIVKRICEASLEPMIENDSRMTMPQSDSVIPMDVFRDIPGYYSKLAIQINGCYEAKWYDACGVVMRKVIESLIIDVYAQNSRVTEIQDANGDFYMLRTLVDIMIKDTSWALGRDTKKALPEIKQIGDRSAHTRDYITTRKDIDGVRAGFRVAVDELLHKAGHK